MKTETIVVQTESLEDEIGRCNEFVQDAISKDMDEAIQREAKGEKARALLYEKLWAEHQKKHTSSRVRPSGKQPLVDSYGGE